ncbi:peptidase inhibitor family I36 protein [Streptomyces cylindrosporus]|uniref:Peptidase inhibitor family I36 protein n=1 Tax=Streptomyces cylindrosporus TaxID=2927583 RepID=A0ABS9YJN6_9ACTN|nr:peptidase inhibitor family I36 protein [Streptomyces cylindrosporus]MCI3276790.1 peptidase inhibitor family I36 protein [Streptomyces cylindrosporus]
MRCTKTLGTIAGALLLAGGTMLAASPPASALAAAPSGCPSGALCVYSGLNYTGSHSYLQDCNRYWSAFGRDNISASWFNNGTSGRWARIWVDPNFGSANWSANARGTGDPDGRDRVAYNAGSSNDWPWDPSDAAAC